jgi:hypothetical protein
VRIHDNPTPQEDSMCRTVRLLLVTCLTAAFITMPWSGAFASERGIVPTTQPSQSLGDGQVWRSALALVPSESRMMRQSVASTNESKLLLGLIAGAAVVAGATMVAYGRTPTCKGRFGNTTATCDRITTSGAMALGGGAVTFALWALSR